MGTRGFPDLGLGRLGSARDSEQAVTCSGECLFDLFTEETELTRRRGSRLVDIEDFGDGADAGEAVTDSEPVVESGHGESGDEGVNPDAEAGEFDCHEVEVEPVDAAACDLS